MLPSGHIAASYLIAQTAKSAGIPVNTQDLFWIIAAGNAMDLDLFVGMVTGKTGEAHHRQITHTPLGALMLWITASLLIHPDLAVSVIILMALLTHLAMDDLSYWLYRLKVVRSHQNPQINWGYPLTPYHTHPIVTGTGTLLHDYITKTPQVALLDACLTLAALAVFITQLPAAR